MEQRFESEFDLSGGDQVDVEISRALRAGLAGPAEALAWAGLLIERGHPLAADSVAAHFGVADRLTLRQLRLLEQQLRDRGYLARAMQHCRSIAHRGGGPDRQTLKRRRGDRDILTGAVRPELAPTGIATIPSRVLHVVSESKPQRQNGYTIRTHHTVLAQAAAGLEPHVVTPRGSTLGALESEVIDGIPHHRLGLPTTGRLPLTNRLQRYAEQLLEVTQQVRPAVLHAHSNFFNALPAEAVGRATGIPVVYEVRGFWELSWLSSVSDTYGWTDFAELVEEFGAPEAYAWRRDLETAVRAEATQVMTLARTMVARIAESGLPSSGIPLVPNGIEEAMVGDGARDDDLLAAFGVEPDEVVIGCVSSLVAYEGIDVLLHAFDSLRKRHHRVRLFVVGDGPERERLEMLAELLGTDGVTFTGQVPHHDIERFYGLIDVVVVPRRPVPVCELVTPLKPFEALAFGKTLVMSDVAALREIAEDSGAALLFEAGNATSLATVLSDVVARPGDRGVSRRRGMAWVQTHRTWQANAEVYRSVYSRLAQTAAVG